MIVSIVIPAYNSEKTITACLTSLCTQEYSEQYEIILCDSSVDQTPDIIKNRFPGIIYHHFEQKTDPGTARTYGIKVAKGELILFIDSDCRAEPDWIKKMVQMHQTYPEAAAVGGSALNGNDENDLIGWASYMSEFREFIPEQPRAYVAHIPTLNISYKKWVFEKYGFFDPYYYPQEDLVFNYAITRGGHHILFDPAIRVWHTHRSAWSDFLKHQQKIGEITAQVLKILPLSGSWLARNKILYLFLGPLLPVVKFFKTCCLFLRKRPLLLFRHPLSIPVLAMGLAYWFRGFSKGVFSKKMRGL